MRTCPLKRAASWPTRRLSWSLMVSVGLLVSCSSSDDSGLFDDDGGDSVAAFRLSTEFQGAARSLSLAADDSSVMLRGDTAELDQRWRVTRDPSGYYRLTNVEVGEGQSLDIINDGVFDDVRLQPSGDQSGQQWQITPLDNGYCRLTTAFLGAELSLDVVNDDEDSAVRMSSSGDFSGQHWRIQLVSGALAADQVPLACQGDALLSSDITPSSDYRSVDVAGFTVLLHPDVDATAGLADAVLGRLASSVSLIDAALSNSRSEPLRNTAIWIEARDNELEVTRFHRSAETLLQAGLNPDKAGAIEIRSASRFIDLVDGPQPWLLMHELAHAREFLESGLLTLVVGVFEAALADGLYDAVQTIAGGIETAQAANSAIDYFAELTEAYLGLNDFFPFTRDDLLLHDLLGFLLMQQLWD